MGKELLENQEVHDGNDGYKSKDDQDVCINSGSSKEKTAAETKKDQQKNLIEVLHTTVNHFFPEFNDNLREITDPRDQKRIIYKKETMLWSALLMFINKLGSRHQITQKMRKLGEVNLLKNLKQLIGQEDIKEIPHGDSIEYLFQRLKPEEVEELTIKATNKLIKNRVLDKVRLLDKYYMFAMDGLHLYSYDYDHCDKCLVRKDKKTGKKKWMHYNLQGSLVSDKGLCLGTFTEWIENEKGYNKQDCETKACFRMIKKIKKVFPQLQICVLLDGLYAIEPVMKALDDAGFQWIIVFKEGRMPEVYNWIKKVQEKRPLTFAKEEIGKEIEVRRPRTHEERLKRKKAVNEKRIIKKEVTYGYGTYRHWSPENKRNYNIITCTEKEDGKQKCDYTWLHSDGINIDEKTVIDICKKGGRCRWKIENQGINVQKNGGYKLEHQYSRDENSMKIWTLLLYLAHIICQLIEKGSLIGNKIKEKYGTVKNLYLSMFEELNYLTFEMPKERPRIQIRLFWDSG